ncbi:MAG: glucose 1-dehydrogenase [Bacteroidota bacterium]
MNLQNQFDLSNRVAFITGASKGIGLAIARGLCQFGAHVVISSRRAAAVAEVAAGLRAEGLQVSSVGCHMGKPDEIAAAIDTIGEEHGRLDILINNAATNPVYGPIQDADEAAFDKIMQVNVKGPFMLCKAAYPLLKASPGASVINISSIEAIKPDQGLGLYSVSKAALVTMTQVMAKEWGAAGIRVNTICPGLVKTKFSAALWQNEQMMAHINTQLPLGRIAQPEEMVGLALFLASDASSYCTGGMYLADGGYVIA